MLYKEKTRHPWWRQGGEGEGDHGPLRADVSARGDCAVGAVVAVVVWRGGSVRHEVAPRRVACVALLAEIGGRANRTVAIVGEESEAVLRAVDAA